MAPGGPNLRSSSPKKRRVSPGQATCERTMSTRRGRRRRPARQRPAAIAARVPLAIHRVPVSQGRRRTAGRTGASRARLCGETVRAMDEERELPPLGLLGDGVALQRGRETALVPTASRPARPAPGRSQALRELGLVLQLGPLVVTRRGPRRGRRDELQRVERARPRVVVLEEEAVGRDPGEMGFAITS